MVKQFYNFIFIMTIGLTLKSCCSTRIITCQDGRPVSYPKSEKCASNIYKDDVKYFSANLKATVNVFDKITVGVDKMEIKNEARLLKDKLDQESIRLQETLKASYLGITKDPCYNSERHYKIIESVNYYNYKLQELRAKLESETKEAEIGSIINNYLYFDIVNNYLNSTLVQTNSEVQINSDSNDCPTLTIANHTTNDGVNLTCWEKTLITGRLGDIINIAIYYHNSMEEPIEDVSFKLTDFRNKEIYEGEEYAFHGQILSKGKVLTSSVVRLKIVSGKGRMKFNQVRYYDKEFNSDVLLENGKEIFKDEGLSIGLLPNGWKNQGVIKISFELI